MGVSKTTSTRQFNFLLLSFLSFLSLFLQVVCSCLINMGSIQDKRLPVWGNFHEIYYMQRNWAIESKIFSKFGGAFLCTCIYILREACVRLLFYHAYYDWTFSGNIAWFVEIDYELSHILLLAIWSKFESYSKFERRRKLNFKPRDLSILAISKFCEKITT